LWEKLHQIAPALDLPSLLMQTNAYSAIWRCSKLLTVRNFFFEFLCAPVSYSDVVQTSTSRQRYDVQRQPIRHNQEPGYLIQWKKHVYSHSFRWRLNFWFLWCNVQIKYITKSIFCYFITILKPFDSQHWLFGKNIILALMFRTSFLGTTILWFLFHYLIL